MQLLTVCLGLLLSAANAQSPNCNDDFTCFDDDETNIVWVIGSRTSTCSDTCDDFSGSSEYTCKENQPIFRDESFDRIAEGLGFTCKSGGCGNFNPGDMMWVSKDFKDSKNPSCYYPTSENYGCSGKTGNANCFGTRYNLMCACVKKEDEPPTPAPTCRATPDPFTCNDPYNCWKDDTADIVWVMGGGIFENCKSTCEKAMNKKTDFYSCKSDQPTHKNADEFSSISTGMGFDCKKADCFSSPSNSELMWIDKSENCERECIFPDEEEANYSCDSSVGNANCFGTRYTLPCPCHVRALDKACEWKCPDNSASVAPWPEDEDGDSCLERINYWRKRACEENWPECPPAGLPPYVECTSCHQCANTQSEYDSINGSHASFKRCGEMVQGSGGGRTCKDVIDSFVSERESTGICNGHCGPIVKAGCNTFHWGRTETPSSNGFHHYTLNWGNCRTDKCDAHCDSVENSDVACFASGIDTPGCSPGTPNSPPQSDPTGPPQSNPTPVSSPIMSPTDSCPSGESSMTIKIQTDEHVNKDKSKLKVKQRVKKATGGFRWKNVKGMSASLRKLKNKNVTRRKCLLKSKCYRIQVIEKKNAVNMGMEGPITVIFKDITKMHSSWSKRKLSFTVGNCSK